MPDQDRKPRFNYTLNHDLGDGPRCPSCRGTGVTFQADCLCCGREVVVSQDSKADDISASFSNFNIKCELFEAAVPFPAVPSPLNERPRRGNAPTLRSHNQSERPAIGIREGPRYGSLGLLQQQQTNARSVVKSSRGSKSAGRGAGGAHRTFKGVRTRKGVKGFLVEIRPPKWRRTIWLGTYTTSREAAGAYDAGVFYTKKANTKYNFQTSVGAFPPLPAHLRLDRPDTHEEIKLFVQAQAKLAARRHLRESCMESKVQPTSSGSCLTGSDSAEPQNDEVVESNSSEFQNMPMDLEFIEKTIYHTEEEANMFLEYNNFVSQRPGPGA